MRKQPHVHGKTAESPDISKEDSVSRWPMHQSKIQCVVLGISQTRVSQVKAGESFPSDTLYQEVSVSPASALCACKGFKVGAAQTLRLGLVLVLGSF